MQGMEDFLNSPVRKNTHPHFHEKYMGKNMQHSYELHFEKTNNLHRRKQRQRSGSQ